MDEPLSSHTTFKIGGPAKYFAQVNDADNLRLLLDVLIPNKISFFILGGGSNLLISDKGFEGAVIRLGGEFKSFRIDGARLISGAGAQTALLVKSSVEKELSGIEYLSGIPGTIGGAVFGNAGSRQEWIGNAVKTLKVLKFNGDIVTMNNDKIVFGYRKTNLSNLVILECEINLKSAPKNDILNRINEVETRRRAMQPAGVFCAGSIFKNPQSGSAGYLIEKAGLKGTVFGGAEVSRVHANFIVNKGSAKASDVKSLIHIVRDKVKEKFGVELELEIKLIGE